MNLFAPTAPSPPDPRPIFVALLARHRDPARYAARLARAQGLLGPKCSAIGLLAAELAEHDLAPGAMALVLDHLRSCQGKILARYDREPGLTKHRAFVILLEEAAWGPDRKDAPS